MSQLFRPVLLIGLLTFSVITSAQTLAEAQVIQVDITTDKSSPSITLSWARQNGTTSNTIYRRDNLGSGSWNTIATLTVNDTSYTDSNVIVGEDYEYRLQTNVSSGYVYSGIEAEPSHQANGIILVIDSTYKQSLATSLSTFIDDLYREGWEVEAIYVDPSETPVDVKAKIIDKKNLMFFASTVLIIGHVAVPYSGDFSAFSGTPPPDGHVEGSGNHTGAWPADLYYGELDGNWTDASVNRVTGNQSRHHNVPGDGKFDQSKIPSDVELSVGRIDLSNMPQFSDPDSVLMKNYFMRNHAWRSGQTQTVERALVDNNFLGLNLASTAYHNFSTFLPNQQIENSDYFTEMKTKPYLWSYGCGAGSYTSCNRVGTTADFANDSLQSIFTMLAGSYFGDWDIKNNLLRAPLCNSALLSFWGGIPKWYMHSMALGKHAGIGVLASQNNNNDYFNGNFNGSHRGVYIALMGDPTLTMRPFAGPSDLQIVSSENKVSLNWVAAPGSVDGYYVYRVLTGRFLDLINTTPIQGTSFVDSMNTTSGPAEYLVRATRIDQTSSGSFVNLSQGIIDTVEHVYDPNLSVSVIEKNYTYNVLPNPGNGDITVEWNDKTVDQIQIRNMLGGIIFKQKVFDSSIQTDLYDEEGIYFIEFWSDDKQKHVRRYVLIK